MSQDFLDRVRPYKKRAEERLEANLKSPLELVREVGRHILLSGGKRLRPILFLLSVELCGKGREYDRYSSIFEYLHCASLLHDDVIDEAETRRGGQVASRRWGNPTAILVGDHLFARSLALASEAEKPRMIAVLSECIARLAEGQILELMRQGDLQTPYETYLEIITAKTAVLLSASTQVGAIIAASGRADDPAREEALQGYGMELGVAFQMIDDLLDWAGEEALVGKPLGQDLKEGKATLPWIHTLEQASPTQRRELLARAGRGGFGPDDLAWIKARVEESGGLTACLDKALEYKDRAKARLEIFPDSPARELLAELADYVCRRRI